MRIRTLRSFVALGAVAAVLLAGCGTESPGDAGDSTQTSAGHTPSPVTSAPTTSSPQPTRDLPAAQVFPSLPACDSDESTSIVSPSNSPRGTIPDGFVPMRTVLCQQSLSTGASTATNSVVTWTTSSTQDLEPILTMLALPTDAPTMDPCPAMAEVVPVLWIEAADHTAIAPAFPTDGCGFTKPQVRETLQAVFGS